MAAEPKTNNMARTTGKSGFKMRSGNSPLRQTDIETREIKLGGEIKKFFSDLHTDLQGRATAHSEWKAKRKEAGKDSLGRTKMERDRAEKKTRNPGESKFQADVRRGKERRAKEKAAKADKPVTRTPEELKGIKKKDIVTTKITPGTDYNYNVFDGFSDPTLAGATKAPKPEKALEKKKRPPGSSVSYQKKHKTGAYTPGRYYKSAHEGIVKVEDAIEGDWYKVQDPNSSTFGKTYQFKGGTYGSPVDKKSPTKKSGFKMKSSPAKIYDTKGKRRKDYKY